MLDSIFGNVFGKSKKDKNSNNPNNANNGSNGETSESFVVVGQQSLVSDGTEEHSLYPRVTTMLTNEMIVGQTSSVQSMSVSVVRTVSYNCPIDNIPFIPLNSSGNHLLDNHSLGFDRCMETIERIQQYIESHSVYNFHLENTILSESLLS